MLYDVCSEFPNFISHFSFKQLVQVHNSYFSPLKHHSNDTVRKFSGFLNSVSGLERIWSRHHHRTSLCVYFGSA